MIPPGALSGAGGKANREGLLVEFLCQAWVQLLLMALLPIMLLLLVGLLVFRAIQAQQRQQQRVEQLRHVYGPPVMNQAERCPGCSQSNPLGTRFCHQCGIQLFREPPRLTHPLPPKL
jgi:hypothetical protein